MSNLFMTPPIRRFLLQVQLFLGLLGLLTLLVGAGRIAAEFIPLGATFLDGSLPGAMNLPGLLVAGGLALAGYACWYALLTIGARESLALNNLWLALGLLLASLAALSVWLLTLRLLYGVGALALTVISALVTYLIWGRSRKLELWKAFGQRFKRPPNRRLLYAVLGLTAFLMLTFGVILAILEERIEIPLPQAEAGELLYSTTFDAYMDEWELAQGRQRAEVVDGELVLTEGSGVYGAGFFALLRDRKFRDFDLRVTTRQIGGSDENTYGVLFRHQDGLNYYLFEISGNGFYRLSRTVDGQTTNITPWIPTEIIHQGNQRNEVRIIARGEEFTFLINQKPVPICPIGERRRAIYNPYTGECVSNPWETSFRDDSIAQGRIGLAVGTTSDTDITQPVIIGFDNVVVMGPDSLYPFGEPTPPIILTATPSTESATSGTPETTPEAATPSAEENE